MAYTKESLLSKIGELLVEINDSYAEISENGSGAEGDLLLLEAKAKFLTTHVAVLRTLFSAVPTEANRDVAGGRVSEDTFFTPPVALVEEPDGQPVEEEIQEIQPEAQAPLNTPTPIAASTSYVRDAGTEPSSTTDETTASAAAENTLFNAPPAKEADRIEDRRPTLPQVEVPTKEEAVETPPQVVVNAVVEEPKEIVLENKPSVEEEKPTRPLTLNEMLQQQRKAGLASGLGNNAPQGGTGKTVDLKSVINLNDKLMFIKDLFNGYSLAYSEAIELLNRYNTFAEADAFLQTNYALKNNWADKPQTVEKLYAILRKKFMQ